MPPKSEPQTGALEEFLLENALHMESGSQKESAVNWTNWIKLWWVSVTAAVLVVIVPLVMWRWKLYEGFGHSVFEALFIAAVLTLAVDPFLKRRLIQDAAKDIFHHLLGIDFPPVIREAFQKSLLGGKTYREHAEIDAEVHREGEDRVVLEMCVRWTVVAAKQENDYQQLLEFEESENPKILQVSITSDSNEPRWSPQNRPLVDGSKPANGVGPGLSCFTSIILLRASPI